MVDFRKLLPALLILPLALTAEAQQTLRVAASVDLQPLLPPILSEFAAQTGIHGQASFQPSSTLAAQIVNGAAFDVFLATDLSFPQTVIAAGKAEEAQPIVYAQGTLVLWARNDSRFKTLTVDSLRDPDLRSLAIANADHAPYGRAAEAALAKFGLMDAMKPKLRVGEDAAQAAQLVESGSAELGLISLTSAMTAHMRDIGHYVVIPREAYPPILQGLVVVKRAGGDTAAAYRLVDFLGSPAVIRELEAGGLDPVPAGAAK